MTQSAITIVVPCFNEANAVAPLAERLNRVLPQIANELGASFSLLFVDDGSTDATVEKLGALEFACPAEVLVLSRNFGKEVALTAGLEAASGDAVVLMDADLQHPPEMVADFIRRWREGHDVVYAYKPDRAAEGPAHRLFGRLFYWMINYGNRVRVPKNAGDFRLMDRKVVQVLRNLPERERFMKGLFAWVGFKQVGLPLPSHAREGGGTSRFNLIHTIQLALDGMTAFSIAPIRLISLSGITVAALSVLYMAWIVLEWLLIGAPFSGFASLAVLLVFFGGVQLLCLGLVGEYVGRALIEAKSRPCYVVREARQLKLAKREAA
jgi:polyisoprenyl-phosphate glycosyltransferase